MIRPDDLVQRFHPRTLRWFARVRTRLGRDHRLVFAGRVRSWPNMVLWEQGIYHPRFKARRSGYAMHGIWLTFEFLAECTGRPSSYGIRITLRGKRTSSLWAQVDGETYKDTVQGLESLFEYATSEVLLTALSQDVLGIFEPMPDARQILNNRVRLRRNPLSCWACGLP